MISQNRGGLPIFLADLGVAVEDGIKRWGIDGFKPGDVLIMNHGGVCGQHLNNVVIYCPIFHDGEIVAFAANRAHWIDIGGARIGFGSSATTEIYRRGHPDALAQDIRRGPAQRNAVADHPRQRALPGFRSRRLARADGVLPARRAALLRAARSLRAGDRRGLHRQDLGSGRQRRACGGREHPRWRLHGRKPARQRRAHAR